MADYIENKLPELGAEYKTFFSELKNKIQSARMKAALAINCELIKLYWYIGKQIIDRQDWGSKLITTLSRDLQYAFPETSGFSERNLQRMRQFAAYYPDFKILPQAVAQLPWGHIAVLIHKVKNEKARNWYADKAIEEGWTRISLERHIKENLFQRQAISSNKASNYLVRLPSPQSSLAQELLKQPYNFDFLGLHDEAHEREIEYAATEHITKFLLELGKALHSLVVVPISLEDSEYFIDMLFYHLKLHLTLYVSLKRQNLNQNMRGSLIFI
jgi:predicted nuclease of restriction endonuclease-like (RecB) superfamily